MSEVVRVEVDDHVATVTLNRPEKLNAVSQDVFLGLYEAGRAIEDDADVRAVLIRGEGRAFCAGLDLASIGAIGGRADGPGDASERPRRAAVTQDPTSSGLSTSHDGFVVWQRMAKPVVAAVQGYALGAGFQLALAADIRIAARGAVMSVFEITYGLVPDLGATKRLPELVGSARAKELIWTARRITAEEAEAWGIVNRVVEPERLLDEANAFVRDLASRPPLPIGFAKELVRNAAGLSFEEAISREVAKQAVCIASADAREAIAASFEKRAGRYTGA